LSLATLSDVHTVVQLNENSATAERKLWKEMEIWQENQRAEHQVKH
jgi:hypothetical protein